MCFSHDKFFEVVDKSGLTMTELSDLYGVSRQTLYQWQLGKGPKHWYADYLAQETTAMLLRFIADKTLPFPKGLTRERRRELVFGLMAALDGEDV